ncbi:sodium:calcium antiporter [Candidatus Woesebacteria bacterium]|nr:sodium:calcium antiporter [Candidatus Woesebacteria bacterium]
MMPAIFSFSVGLAVMLISAKVFLDVSTEFSAKWKFSPLFISLVLVALGTNLPELTVTIAALRHADPGLAMGNIVGSSIANITIILGAATLFGKVKIGTTKTQINAFLLLVVTFIFSILALSAVATIYKIILLLSAVFLTFSYEYIMAVNGRKHEDKKLLKLIEKLNNKKKKYPAIVYVIMFFGSLTGLGFGGNVTVDSIAELSKILGLSTTILGLTLTAVATSLPELLTSIIASKKKDNKVVLGTLIGSNIFNLTLFAAIILNYTTDFRIKKFVSIKEIFFLIFSTLIFYIIVKKYSGKVITKEISLLFITIFAVFSVFIFYL